MTVQSPPSIALVDYGMGNRRSVEKAFAHIGVPVRLTSDLEALDRADALVLPGVGAFPKGMRQLTELGLASLLRRRAEAGTPLLGICLGMQLLFERSSELGQTEGLGLIEGEVRPLRCPGLRVPHIGWNEVRFERRSPLTEGLPESGTAFYHVHSFAAHPHHSDDVVGSTEYGERFATIVARENVLGVQFHPEKSSTDGLRLLQNFCSVAAARRRVPA